MAEALDPPGCRSSAREWILDACGSCRNAGPRGGVREADRRGVSSGRSQGEGMYARENQPLRSSAASQAQPAAVVSSGAAALAAAPDAPHAVPSGTASAPPWRERCASLAQDEADAAPCMAANRRRASNEAAL